jgi:uncharacterized RDD family membrane protein YckC
MDELIPHDQSYSSEPVGFSARLWTCVADLMVVILFSAFIFDLLFEKSQANIWGSLPLLILFVWIVYRGLMDSHLFGGQTVGRAVQRIRVVAEDGSGLTVSESFLRIGLVTLGVLFPPLGIIDALFLKFDRKKCRALHDRFSGSRVVDDVYDWEGFSRVRAIAVCTVLVVAFNFVRLYTEKRDQAREVSGEPKVTSASAVNLTPATFLEELEETAAKGDPKSQLILGNAYLSGKELPQNYKEAARWFKRAAAQGNARGQYQLAVLYVSGKGVPKDFAKGIKLLKQAADGGDSDAKDVLKKLASVK